MILFRRIAGNSMLPAIRHGQLVMAVRKRPKVGDVVVTNVAGRDVVKRIDKLSEGRVYLLGDNAAASTDSRSYGYLSNKAVLGVAVLPRVSRRKND